MMVDMNQFRELAKNLGVKIADYLPENEPGAVIRTGSGELMMLRCWNESDGQGNRYAWFNGYRDVEISEIGNDWGLVK